MFVLKNILFSSSFFYLIFLENGEGALFLDLLIHEIHFHLLNKKKPDFSCVFFNAGAHIQHHYLLNSLANKTSIKNPNHILKSYEDPFKKL